MRDFVYCTSCGIRSPGYAQFCRECGSRLVQAPIQEPSPVEANSPEQNHFGRSSSSSISTANTNKTRDETSRSNPVIRHWRGDYPLHIAVLVIGFSVLVTLGLYGLLIQLLDATLNYPNLTFVGLSMIFPSVLFCGLTSWYLVGVWRTARRSIKTSARPALGWSVIVVVGAVTAQVLYLNGPLVFQTLVDGLKLLDGKSDVGSYEIRLLNNSKEVVFSGSLDYGATNSLENVLRVTPGLEIIHLESVGGLIREGRALGKLIRRYNLITYTARECSSACIIAYVAGKQRFLGEGGRLGFHSGRIGFVSGTERYEINDEFREVFADRGINSTFIDQAMAVEPDYMWFPDKNELKEANVIDAIVNSNYYGTSNVSEWITLNDFESTLLLNKLFRELKMHEPVLYQEAIGKFVAGLSKGIPMASLQAELRNSLYSVIVPRYFSKSPDAELISYYQTQSDELAELRGIDVQHCVDFLFPELASRPLDLASLLSDELKKQDISRAGDVLEAAFDRPVFYDEATGERALTKILVAIITADAESGKIIADPAAYRDQPEKLCRAGAVLFETILAPERRAEAGSVIRYLMANN